MVTFHFSSGFTKSYLFLSFILLAGLLISCESPTQRTARSVGVTSEILVVTQSPAQWEGAPGQAVRDYFGQAQYGLPQEEPIFKIAHIQVDNMSDMFKKHRNILLIEIGPGQEEPLIETRPDLWAKPQRVVKIRAKSTDEWVETFASRKEGLKLLYDQTERERLLTILRPTAKASVVEALYKHMGVSMVIPDGFFVAKTEHNFMWIRRETSENSQGLIIWRLPYRDTLQLKSAYLIYTRDSIVSKHIPGPSPGSFMTTDKEFVPPMIKRVGYFVADFAVENRGMWNLVGDYMAGPYLSYTVIDQKNGGLLTVEGYVYAPNKDKRDLLRQLEAMMFSLNINP
ncbi:MAG: DUF4837 family protein [Bacteroidales bacterium]|nr:DUF4837 family protein [Bacteroidales bacterium]